ncbi:E3 ubiquitin-protein ligase TRIM39-like isoform X2 [Ambystoma mexicanum]|uniref:E3 ubiquitin-protein ligase TRIM39-like isoform X2 n=1 Tax=Ambystoma mexicanum TaxID=8296 RepID=UPI0037E8AE04
MAAAAAAQAETLASQLTCSICLDYYKDPVILGCGHNFCQACLVRFGARFDICMFRCPQCKVAHFDRNFQYNLQLGNIVDAMKILLPDMKQGNLCEKHFERLQLFCEDDMQLMCVVCDRSQEHRSHKVIPVEEAATKYKECLQSSVKEMKNDLRDVSATAEEQKRAMTEEEFKGERKKIVATFGQLHRFMEKEMQDLLGELKKQEQEILSNFEQKMSELKVHNSSLKKLIGELEGAWNQDLKLLTVAQSSISRAAEIKSLQLRVVCAEMGRNFHDFATLHTYVQEKIMQLKETFPDELEITYAKYFQFGPLPLTEVLVYPSNCRCTCTRYDSRHN